MEDIVNKEYQKVKKSPFFIRAIKKAYDYSSKHINYKIGAAAGVIAGGIVFYINKDHSSLSALGSAGKQFAYNLFVGGYNMKLCEKLAKGYSSRKVSVGLATFVPPAVAFLVTYSIHKFGGTPEAFKSSIWQVPLNLFTSAAFGTYFRRKHEKTLDNYL